MVFDLKVSQIITVLFPFAIFLRYVGGAFHLVNIGIPIAGTVLLSAVYSYHTKKMFSNLGYVVLVFSFILFLFVGTFFSNAPIYGRQKVFTLFLFSVLTISSAKYVIENFTLYLISSLFFFFAFIAIYFMFYRSFGNVLSMLNPKDRLEMGGDVFNAISASRYIGLNIIVLFFLFFRQKINIRFKYLIFGGILSVGAVMMLLFASKGPILSLIMAPLLYTLLHKKMTLRKAFLLGVAIVAFGTILVYPQAIVELLPLKYRPYFEDRFFNYAGYMQDRPTLLNLALSNINSENFMFGSGTGNYGFLYAHFDARMYPHNIFVELLYENGLISILFFIVLFRYLFTKSSLTNYFSANSFFTILIYFFLLNSQVSGDIGGNYALFVFLLLLHQQKSNEKTILNIFKLSRKILKPTSPPRFKLVK